MEKRSFVNQSAIINISLALIGVVALLASFDIPRDPDGRLGARVFPLIAAGSLVLLGTIGFLADLKPAAKTGNEDEESKNNLVQIFLLLVLSIFYIWLISKLGYLISTAITAPLILMLFGVYKRPFILIIAAIACPLIYHAIFFIGLGVYPPFGEWFDLLDVFRK